MTLGQGVSTSEGGGRAVEGGGGSGRWGCLEKNHSYSYVEAEMGEKLALSLFFSFIHS